MNTDKLMKKYVPKKV